MQTSKMFPILVSALALLLLVIHTFGWGALRVDSTSIFLLVLIVLAPLSDLIRKIKFGDFEAEIGSREIKKVSESLDFSAAGKPSISAHIQSDIPKLVESDPKLGMAMLRIVLATIIKVIDFLVVRPVIVSAR